MVTAGDPLSSEQAQTDKNEPLLGSNADKSNDAVLKFMITPKRSISIVVALLNGQKGRRFSLLLSYIYGLCQDQTQAD